MTSDGNGGGPKKKSRQASRRRISRRYPSAGLTDSGDLSMAWLKGSVGEGPNRTNYSDQSPVRILAKFRNFR